jgi:hypothetical protein
MKPYLTLKAAAFVATAGLAALAGCNQLAVDNPNSPDAQRALATATDAENLMSGYYKRWHEGLYRTTGNFEGMANIMSFQNYSDLANNCQNARFPFSGAINLNTIGNVCAGEQARLYQYMQEVTRVASTLLGRMDDGLTLGSPGRDARYRAFGEFLRGVSLGYAALFYDSAAVVSPATPAEDAGKLVAYTVAMDSAYVALQRAIDAANTPGFVTLDATWIPTPTPLNGADFIRLIRSYRARLRANVARTPADRAAVNWDLVIADAQNGITANHSNITNPTNGPFRSWVAQYDPPNGLWHQMPPWIIGMGDVSGSYAAWIATPVGARGAGNTAFFMVTPDLRFPQGATRADQQADFAMTSCEKAAQVCKRYFANRIGNDQFNSLGWGWSNYDFVRFHSWARAGDAGSGTAGAIVFMTKAEIDLLEAEGQLRKGNFAAAAALINKTRTANGLPALVDLNNTSPVPGGTNCVPKVPVSPYNVIACGNMFEALKWEKRIETAYTHFAPWFLDGRGWGDLAQDTPLYWAVPYQDLLARGVLPNEVYSTGAGVGTAAGSAAVKGTYGW